MVRTTCYHTWYANRVRFEPTTSATQHSNPIRSTTVPSKAASLIIEEHGRQT
jgi:hypothetical protein